MTVRVLRAGGPEPKRSSGFVPSARRIDAARWEARLEAERLIAEARAEAARLVEAARAEAEAIRETARREGRDAGQAEALATLVRARAEAAALGERATGIVTVATKAVAERAIAATLSTDDAALAGWAREAIATIAGARRIAIRGAPETLARLAHRLRDVAPWAEGAVSLVEEPDCAPFALVASTEVGDLRIDLRTQVDAFVEAIRDVLAAEMGRRHG